MKKVIIKINFLFVLIMLVCNLIPNYRIVIAVESSLENVIKGGNDFINLNINNNSSQVIDTNGLKDLSQFVSGTLLTIAIGVTLLTGTIMGIKFITQSVEDKAKIKESMVPWVIGIIVSFGAFTIWEVAVNVFSNI